MSKIVTLTAALKATIPFVSKEETRYYLNGVAFDHGLLVATDGHKLAAIKPEFYTGADADLFIMPIAVIKQVVAVKSTRKVPLYVSIESGEVFWSATVKEGGEDSPALASFPFKPIDGTFPDWRRVVPKPDSFDKPVQAAFNAAYLGEFKSLGESLKIYLNNDANSPCIIRAKSLCFEAFGVLMPMRDSSGDMMPEWLGQVCKPEAPNAPPKTLDLGGVVVNETKIAKNEGDGREWLIVGELPDIYVLAAVDNGEKSAVEKGEARVAWSAL